MKAKLVISLSFLLLFFVTVDTSIAGWQWIIYHRPSLKGRIIDTETKEPIEGAVVVVLYYKTLLGIPDSLNVIIKVKETLTDNKGEFNFPSYTTVIHPFSYNAWTEFIIYKPGYGNFPNGYDFMVYPVRNVDVVKSIKWKTPQRTSVESIEHGIEEEGIIFWKREWGRKSPGAPERPFISLGNAESRVKDLDIPFDYELGEDFDNVWHVWIDNLPEFFENYTLVGLKKLSTREERLRAVPGSPGFTRSKDLPLLYEAINEEYKRFGVGEVGEGK